MKIYLLLFLLISSTFFSCFRKGEDDPFVSFRSRKARVEGKWKVKTLFVKQVNKYSNHRDEFFQKLENGVYTDSIVEFINGATVVTKGTSKRRILYSFSKGGQFEMKDYKGDKDTMILTGTWTFNVRGGGNRHRELIYINIERQWDTFFGPPPYWVLFRTSQNGFLCQLQELRHKKMVWKDDLVETNVNPTGDYLGYERESYIELEPE